MDEWSIRNHHDHYNLQANQPSLIKLLPRQPEAGREG